jgi:hypothetical protein
LATATTTSELAVAARVLAGFETPVRAHQRAIHLQGRERVGRQPGCVERDAELAAVATGDGDGGNVGHLFDGIMHLGGHAAQLEGAVAVARKGQRQDGDVVDRARLDQRLGGAGGNQVEVREHLLVQVDDALLFVLSHFESHDGEGTAGARGGVDVLDPRYLPEQLLHRLGDAFFHLAGGGAGHADEDIDHGDLDLRFLLARELPDGKSAQSERGGDDQRRQLGIDPQAGEAARDAEL